jgi:hypothetical protein
MVAYLLHIVPNLNVWLWSYVEDMSQLWVGF